jgi:hypothetical protein
LPMSAPTRSMILEQGLPSSPSRRVPYAKGGNWPRSMWPARRPRLAIRLAHGAPGRSAICCSRVALSRASAPPLLALRDIGQRAGNGTRARWDPAP